MKAAISLLAAGLITVAAPAGAQFGGLGKVVDRANQAKSAKDKYDDLNFTDKEERQLGEQVSAKLRDRFGVYQNRDVTKYVTLVGTVLARESSRPGLDWRFVVLDTDGVNAYAAPGGIVHVTRGLLGLMKTEAQLAGVLGHEITHVTAKHTIRAIQQQKLISMGADQAGNSSYRSALVAKAAEHAVQKIYDGEFSREDENEADKTGTQLANKAGYSPKGMLEVLQSIDARNSGREDRNGMFASHPATKDRIQKLEKQIADERLTNTAAVAARYRQNITFDAKPASEIASDVRGANGLASGDKKKDDGKKSDDAGTADQPKKKGLGLGGVTGGKQANSGQQVASAGARGGLPDRDATGGPIKTLVLVSVTPAEVVAFKKGIAS